MKNNWSLFVFLLFFANIVSAQITLGFQGGEAGNTWGYTSTGADAVALAQAGMNPNIVTGSKSIVAGGNTPGGSCFDGGSGDGPDTERKFTFDNLDISTSSNSVRTLTFNWGNRFPVCLGTGWDAGEDLIFTAYHNGIAQPSVTLATGVSNANFSIKTNQYTWSVPTCVTSFYFELKVVTNRRDELLFMDDVKLTAPSLNTAIPNISAISGASPVCVGSTSVLSVNNIANMIYTWSGLPAGASFTTPNGTNASHTMSINWGTAATGTYTITVTPSMNICGVVTQGAPQTINITIINAPAIATSGTATICPGQSATISATGASNYTWDHGLGSGSTFTVSPTTTTTYNVTGTSGNCTVFGSVTITVVPTPSIAVTANPTTICAGATTTLTASGATTYTWQAHPSLNATTGATVTANPTSSVTYMVTGSNGTCTASGSVTVAVTPAPPLTVTASPATICVGGSSTLTASGGSNYTWQANPTLSATTGASVTATPTATTTYTVTGTNGACISTGTVTVTVTPLPVVSATAAQNPICVGSSTVLTASGATTYTWQPAASLNATTGTSVTANPTVTTTYIITGTTGSCTATGFFTLTVVSSPTVAISAAQNTICAGGSTTLTASGATTYTWQPAASLNTPTGTSVTASPATTTTYTVTGTLGTCTSTGSITVTVTPLPVISILASPTSICPGGASTLTASGASNLTWQPNPSLSGTSGATVTATPSTTTTYTVGGLNGTCPGIANVTITVMPAPVVNAGNDQTVCTGIPVTLSGSGADTYSWDNGVIDGVAFIPNADRIYTVIGTTTAGCTGTDQVTVTLEASPTGSFVSDVNRGCLPFDAQFTSTSNGTQSYRWDFGDGTSSTDFNPLHTFVSSGCKNVTLELTSPNGCKTILASATPICADPNPIASFHVNPAALSEDNLSASMINTSENAETYFWNFGDQSTSTEIAPTHTYAPSLDGSYTVTLYTYSENGCVDSVKVILPFAEEPIYYVPNVFTPDGNEMNQTFQPVFTAGYDPTKYTLQIYNRWGERLFESSDPKLGWDGVSVAGTIVPDGIYVWKIEFSLIDSDDRRQLHGHVLLAR